MTTFEVCDEHVQMSTDDLCDLPRRHALVCDSVEHGARRALLQRQSVQARGIQPVYRLPAVGPVPDIRPMARWEPDARGRFVEAALALYGERGFEKTTVAEIAERAGLTEQTFFRHFADKARGSVRRRGCPAGTHRALGGQRARFAGADRCRSRGPRGRRHRILHPGAPRNLATGQTVIDANPELQERELTRLASLSAAIADALRRRGLGDPAARLTAEVAIAVFKTAFERWIDETNDREFTQLVRESLDQVRALTAA